MLLPTKWSPNQSVHCDEQSPTVVMRTDISSQRILCCGNNPIPSAGVVSTFSADTANASSVSLNITGRLYYFEVEILSNVNEGGSAEIAIGIAPVAPTLHTCVDHSFRTNVGSVYFSNTGEVSRRGVISTAVKFGTHDVVGCGLEIGGSWKTFFTCNGTLVPETEGSKFVNLDNTEKVYYPAVEILGVGTTVRANFGSEKFQFDTRGLTLINNPDISVSSSVVPQIIPQPPALGHAQSHSLMCRISNHLTQPSFRHSQSEPNQISTSSTETISLDLQDFQSEDYMVAIASALSLEPSDSVLSSLDSWTDADTSQAQEALMLLQTLVQTRPSHTNSEKFETIAALRENLSDMQVRMRRSIDRSPENQTLLELNDTITETLLEVVELEEIVGENDRNTSLTPSLISTVNGSGQPSLVSIMYMLRRGTKEEVMDSVAQILSICDLERSDLFNPNRYAVATKPINDIRVAGGLQTLVSTLHRCLSWPDVELQISISIAILVSFETDWQILMKESHAILSSLQVLLLRESETNLSVGGHNSANICDNENSRKKLYCLVSSAVRRFCYLLCGECAKPLKLVNMSSFDNETENFPDTTLDIHRNSKASTASLATDEAYLCKTLETLAHLIQSLCKGSIVVNSIDRKQFQGRIGGRIRAMSHSLDNYGVVDEKSRIDPHYHSIGDNMIRSQSTPDFNIAECSNHDCRTDGMTKPMEIGNNFHKAQTHSSNMNSMPCESDLESTTCVIDDVVILCSQSLKDLCQIEDFRASLVAGDVLFLLVKWLKYSTEVLRIMVNENSGKNHACRFSVSHPVTELVNNVTAALGSITAADSSAASSSPQPESSDSRTRNFNRKNSNYAIGWIDAQVMAVDLPIALVGFIGLLVEGVSYESLLAVEHVYRYEELGVATLVTSLISLASRSQNRASLVSCGAPASILRLLTAVITQIKYVHQHSNNVSDSCTTDVARVVKMLQEKSYFNERLAGQCLDFLSFFLADNIADIPSSSSLSGVTDTPPPIVKLFIQPPVFGALLHVISLPPCLARLQAVRVLSMIVEWQQVMELLFQEGIATALAVLLEDANERYEYEVIGQGDEFSKCHGSESPRPTAPRYALEEVMRACYSLANLCHAKLTYALQCFENGLMTIMLRTVRNEHIEVQRQAIRCISGMCPVLSVLTPGAHPSLMIASLKSVSTSLNPTRSQSGSVMETRAIAKKLHGNVIDFVNALRALTHALSSPNMLIKMEALRGISHLAKDDHLRVGIVEGPLQLIISLLLDPQCETELQQLAESVLVNIGFVGGRDDLDVVLKDPYMLSEWFYIRRSLRLQKSCHDLLTHWIDGLFYGCDVAEKRAKQRYIAELGREASLAENVDDEDSSFLHFPEGIDIDIRDTVDLVGLSVVTNVIEKIVEKRRQQQDISFNEHETNNSLPLTTHKQSADLREALLLQFTHLFDAWKLLRHPQTSTLAVRLPSDLLQSVSSNEWIKDKSDNYFGFSPGGSGKKRTSGHITERFFAFMTFCSGKGAQRVVDEEEETQKCDMFAEEKVKSQSMERDDRSLNLSNYAYSLDDMADGLNFAPPKVSECLDLFFPSKLHQALVCDLFSVGKSITDHITSSQSPHNATQNQNFGTPPRPHLPECKSFRVPEPKQFRSVVFPSRTYFSFVREGRVLKKILDDVTNVDKNDLSVEASSFGGYADANKTLWALSFRNSIFHGEFIMTLVNTLRSLPQISSLSFVCKTPQEDSELGYFGGNVPATVRFLSFQNALSSSSIDVLCTYLRAQNFSFRRDFSECNTGREENSSDVVTSCNIANQGLVGLSITHSTLSAEDVNNICVLLQGSSHKESVFGRFGANDESLKKGARLVDGVSSPASQRMCGLRYIDLSHNKLSDEQCSYIISAAAMNSPLEGLELKGNDIHRGLYFCPVLEKYVSSRQCRLLHLGVSSNGIINSTFRTILDCCRNDSSLTSLDLSNNGLTSSDKNSSRVREFLKSNITLRILNLSHNRFTYGMTRIFHLGLLENDSLILLRLDGNISLNEREMYLVRGKLKANRDRYVKGYPASVAHPAGGRAPHTVNSERDYPSKRRSESSALGSALLSFKSAETSSNLDDGALDTKIIGSISEATDVRMQHERTFSDLGDGEKTDISNFYHSNPVVVATEVLNRDENDDVPVSAAVYPLGKSIEAPLAPVMASQTICVLFSAPLAWTDTKNRLHPIQTLDYPGERDTLIQAFREVSRDIGVRFDFATTDTLRTALSLGVKMLHFSGHGHPHCLNFEDGRSGLQFVTMDALRALCTAGGNNLEFVFVSACHSRRAGETFVGAGVPHVVCVNVDAQLLDAAAMAFTRAFYLALADGHTVKHSFDIGKQAVFNSPYVPNSLVEGEKFLLLPENADHNTPVFHAKPVSQWPIPGSSLRGLTCDLIDNSYLPHTPEDFEGREIDMYSTIRILLSRRLVTIVGENGVGKSSVAIAVCSYLAERRKFENGVIFARMRGVVTHEDFLLSLAHAIKFGSPSLASRYILLKDYLKKGKEKLSLSIRDQEELLLSFLSPLKALIVLGNISGLLTASSETSTDLKMFLGRLFDRCKYIKILTTANEVIGMTGFGMVEHVVSLGPLSLYSSLRLFARLSPVLATAALKLQFVKALLIPDQANVTLESKELGSAAAQILYMLGGGHPSKIVKIACESSAERIEQMKSRAPSKSKEK